MYSPMTRTVLTSALQFEVHDVEEGIFRENGKPRVDELPHRLKNSMHCETILGLSLWLVLA